jgi:hypothetical protein
MNSINENEKEKTPAKKRVAQNPTTYMREWKRKAYEADPTKMLNKNKAYYIKYKYNLTGEEMKKYGNHLPLVMKIKKGLEELSNVKPDFMAEILAEYQPII